MELTDRLSALAGRRSDEEDGAARRAVIHEWENWAALHPDDAKDPRAGAFFFIHLQEKRSELLNFPSTGDRWQKVCDWLLQEGCVKVLYSTERSEIWNWGRNSSG
jgi:hypothetical protein